MVVGRKEVKEVGESKMKLKLLNQKGDFLQFLLTEEDASFANALRRIMINEVPTMAVQEVEFRKNSSILYDEIVAHRLGLLPLKTDLKSYTLPEKCTCKGEGCAKCQLKLTLSAKGPKTVYASEIKSQDPKSKPVFGKTPIVKLLEGQELEFEAVATLGVGKNHAKHSPAHVYYNNETVVTVNNDSSHFDEFKDRFPAEVFKNGKIDKDLIVKNELVDACDGINEDVVKVEYTPGTFIFNIESWGQLEPKEIVIQALEHLKETSDEFVKVVSDLDKKK
jgi:DNA-directed RNA polymerase subunit D